MGPFWTAVLYTACWLALLILAGMAYQAIGAWRDARRFPPPGRMVDVGGHRLHLHSLGAGRPAVIFDAALGGTSVSWRLVQPVIAEFTRAISYDRAGLGWSDPGPEPRTARRAAEELHTLLCNAGIAGPYVLVGHSYGGLAAREFVRLYREEVCGLVLVDAPHAEAWARPAPEQEFRLKRGAVLARRGALAARLGIARLIALLARTGAFGLARLGVAMVSEGDLRGHENRLLAPLFRVPAELRPALRAFWTHPKFYAALASHMESLVESAAEIAASPGFGDLPLVVITASNPTPARVREQEHVAGLSTRGRHIIAKDSSHWIQLDEPALVAETIRAMAESARKIAC